MITRYTFPVVVVALLLLTSCRSSSSATASQTRMSGSSSHSVLNGSVVSDTASTFTVSHSNGYTFTRQTQTITMYDTTQPGNPVSQVTQTQKDSFSGIQDTWQHTSQSASSQENHSQSSQLTDFQLQNHETSRQQSVPVVQSTARYYFIASLLSFLVAGIAYFKRKA